ncbi:MAG: hypothetical protein ILNGONEN_02144 [Syntrophorhabdaceae bacterium]|nr:hypothetical protein [Syntrophorhabdaceae bacterium]
MNMEIITYSQVQDFISRLSIAKLPLVYNWLIDLTTKETNQPSPQLDFMCLPLSERRRIMAQQAEGMVAHYEQTADGREVWQSGDFKNED